MFRRVADSVEPGRVSAGRVGYAGCALHTSLIVASDSSNPSVQGEVVELRAFRLQEAIATGHRGEQPLRACRSSSGRTLHVARDFRKFSPQLCIWPKPRLSRVCLVFRISSRISFLKSPRVCSAYRPPNFFTFLLVEAPQLL